MKQKLLKGKVSLKTCIISTGKKKQAILQALWKWAKESKNNTEAKHSMCEERARRPLVRETKNILQDLRKWAKKIKQGNWKGTN